MTDGSLLAAAFVAGLLATNQTPGPHAHLRGVHVLVALTATMCTLAVHSIAYTYFLATGKWAAEVVRVYGLPTWINDQAKRNKRKAFRFEFWGMSTIAIAAWLGAGADAQGLNPLWHLAGAAGASAFNLVAFGVVYAVILQQARLLLEVKDQADRLRASVTVRWEPPKRIRPLRGSRKSRLPGMTS